MVMFKSRCTSIRLNASLASSSDLAPIMSSMSFLEGLIQAKPPLKPFC